MILLSAAVCIDIAVVVIKLLFGAWYPLLGGTYVDTVLVVIGFHLFGFFQISV